MALENGNGSGNGMVMPVSPMYGGGNGGFGNGFGDSGWWILLLILFASGGWGNGFGGGNMGGFAPYAIDTGVQRGFDQASIMSGIGDINAGIFGIQNALCNGFAQAEIAANSRQMASMNQNFQMQSALADCCCENRLGIANLGSDIAREACATRTNDTQNTQSILNVINGGIQSIKDQLCSDKIDAKNEKIADLERQLTMATMQASQTAQTSRILSDNAAQTVALEQYLNPVPVPAYIVQNPNCCQQNNGCGCGF